jgi:hypothetical protein
MGGEMHRKPGLSVHEWQDVGTKRRALTHRGTQMARKRQFRVHIAKLIHRKGSFLVRGLPNIYSMERSPSAAVGATANIFTQKAVV